MRPPHRPRASSRGVLALTFSTLVGALPVQAQSLMAAQETTTVVVMPFEFAAAVPSHPRVAPPHRPSIWPPMVGQPLVGGRAPYFVPRLAHRPTPAPAAPPETAANERREDDPIGVGIADLLVARLLDVPGFRVVERRRLDLLANEQRLAAGDSLARRDTASAPGGATLLRARYIITGSVTRFGTEERRGLGGLGGAFGLGALGFKKPKTQVTLTARIIDAKTGEVLAGLTGAGTSTKGGSVLIGGAGGGVGGGVAITSSEFRASALGEATERAIEALVQGIVAKRGRLRSG